MPTHVPVMLAEVLEALAPERGGTYVDGTVGLGGHAAALMEAGATRLLGIDRDGEALDVARDRLAAWGERVTLQHGDYRQLKAWLDAAGIRSVDRILVDLGLSSFRWKAKGADSSFARRAPRHGMDRLNRPHAEELDLHPSKTRPRQPGLRVCQETILAPLRSAKLPRPRPNSLIENTVSLSEHVASKPYPGKGFTRDSPGPPHLSGSVNSGETLNQGVGLFLGNI